MGWNLDNRKIEILGKSCLDLYKMQIQVFLYQNVLHLKLLITI